MDKKEIKESLRSRGDEYHYRNEKVDIGGDLIGPKHLEVRHFVVQRDARGENRASIILECLLDVLQEDNISTLTIEMGATECYTMEELEEYRSNHDHDDPTAEFLNKFGFEIIDTKETYKWGLVFRGRKYI